MSSEEDVVGAGADGADKRPAKIRNVAMVVACAMLTSTNYKDLSHGPYTLPTAITNYTSYERNELLSGDVVAVDVHRVLEEILRPEPAFHAAATDHLPIYTPDMAKEAVRPNTWKCCGRHDDNYCQHHNGNQTNVNAVTHQPHTIFAFVHIYKASGTTIRNFFHEFAYACQSMWISLGKCTDVRPSTISDSPTGFWQPCVLEEIVDGHNKVKWHYGDPPDKHFMEFQHGKKVGVNGQLLADTADIIGGHSRIGTGEYVFRSSDEGTVRHIVFLRSPIERYVSGVLYQNRIHKRTETLDEVVIKIKEQIKNKRMEDKYWDKSLSYLLTPVQRVENNDLHLERRLRERLGDGATMMDLSNNLTGSSSASALAAEVRCKLAIRNLYHYNAIIGMTEKMTESLHILKYAMLTNTAMKGDIHTPPTAKNNSKDAEAVFDKYTPLLPVKNSTAAAKIRVRANSSNKALSTTAILEALRNDTEHMVQFKEFVKYEQHITDFAWTMHRLQYNVVMMDGT